MKIRNGRKQRHPVVRAEDTVLQNQETDMSADTQKIAEAVAEAITPIVQETIAHELEQQASESADEETVLLTNEDVGEVEDVIESKPDSNEETGGDQPTEEPEKEEIPFLEQLRAAREKTQDVVEIFAMLGLEVTPENVKLVWEGITELQTTQKAATQVVAKRGSRVAWLKEALRSTYGTGVFTVKAAAEKFEVNERDIRVAIDSARAKQGQGTVENGGRGTGQFRFTV